MVHLSNRCGLTEALEPRRLLSFTSIDVPPPANGWDGQQFPLPQVAAAPDGNFWIADPQGPRVVKVTPSGQATDFPLNQTAVPMAVALTNDGTAWFADQGTPAIGRITPDGTVTEFPLGQTSAVPLAITTGPHGSVWFLEDDGTVGRISADGKITLLPEPTDSDGSIRSDVVYQPAPALVFGPGGDLFLAGNTVDDQLSLEHVSPAGHYFKSVEFDDGPAVTSLVFAGGRLWAGTQNGQVDRVSPSGHFRPFTIPTPDMTGQLPNALSVVRASDGKVWFVSDVPNNPLGRIGGSTVQQFSIPAGLDPDSMTAAPDGSLWILRGTDGDVPNPQLLHLDLHGALLASGSAADAMPGKPAKLATLTDFARGDKPSDFSVTVDWGDGTTSQGTVRPARGNTFDVFGTHEGDVADANVTVTINDHRSQQTVVAAASVVTLAPQPAGAGIDIQGTAGQLIEVRVADFSNVLLGVLSQYDLSIDWGDGQFLGTAALVPDGKGGAYATGSHRYFTPGSYNVSATLITPGEQVPGVTTMMATTQSTATIAPDTDPHHFLATGFTLLANPTPDSSGYSFNGFQDTNSMSFSGILAYFNSNAPSQGQITFFNPTTTGSITLALSGPGDVTINAGDVQNWTYTIASRTGAAPSFPGPGSGAVDIILGWSSAILFLFHV